MNSKRRELHGVAQPRVRQPLRLDQAAGLVIEQEAAVQFRHRRRTRV